jgi:pSer/pThr/pTyr-binding forkhead associated (FHA) protein
MKLSLVVVNAGKASGQTIAIKIAQFVIGRDPQCNLRPGSAMVSKKHCALLVREGRVFLEDFGSTNGTYLNDERVTGEVPLKNDDVLKVGPLTFKVVIEPTPAPSKPTPPPPPKPAAKASEEDEAAALLLSLEGGSIAPVSESSEAEVPGGSTVMEIPSFGGPPTDGEGKPAKPQDKKEDKAKQHDSASQAAAALIDKMRRGVRK